MNETKRDRFVRIAEQRTQHCLDALRSLSKCAAQASYEYTESDVEQILSAIEKEVQSVRDSFSGKKRFSLSSPDQEEHAGSGPAKETLSQRIESATSRVTQVQSGQTSEPQHEH